MARINVSITAEFRQSIREYAEAHALTESAALVELAAIGLIQATGKNPGALMRAHGGKRERQFILAPEMKTNSKASVTLEASAPSQQPKPLQKLPVNVTLETNSSDLDKQVASLIDLFQFDYRETGEGILKWNVYTKTYKADRPALNKLVKEATSN